MVQFNSFYVSTGEEREIRDIALVFFYKGNPAQDEELRESWMKWKGIFHAFISCVDARYGNLLHFPFEGGYFDQPSKTMACFELLQAYYREKITKDQDNALKKRR